MDRVRRTTHGTRYQVWWVRSYWIATALTVVFLVLALTGSGVGIGSRVSVTLAVVATALGSLMASRIRQHGVTDVDFDDGTSGMRVIAVGWAALVVLLLIAATFGTGFGVTASVDADMADGVVGFSASLATTLFGFAALIAVVGDGYTKYRRLTRRDT
jgi:hypothetical protein